MMFERAVTGLVLAAGITLLAGCGEPTLSSRTLAEFRESYHEMLDSLAPQDEVALDTALRKLVAFTAFRPESLDFSRGVVLVDVASILPKSDYAFVTAAWQTAGKPLDGATAAEVIELSAGAERDMVQRYQRQVDKGIAVARDALENAQNEQRRLESILRSVEAVQGALSQEVTVGGSTVPTLSFRIANGTSATLLAVEIRAMMEVDGLSAERTFLVDFRSDPLRPQENRDVLLRMGGRSWSEPPLKGVHVLPVAFEVIRYTDAEGQQFDAQIPEATDLRGVLASLEAHRGQAREIISSGFRRR